MVVQLIDDYIVMVDKKGINYTLYKTYESENKDGVTIERRKFVAHLSNVEQAIIRCIRELIAQEKEDYVLNLRSYLDEYELLYEKIKSEMKERDL